MNTTDTERASALGEMARAAALAGGRVVRARLGRGTPRRRLAPTGGSARDPVTAIDLASDAAIRATIQRFRSDDAWLTEETGHVAGRSGVRWVVDPLDGTVNVTHGIDRFAISVAAESEWDGAVLAAAVMVPAREELLALAGGVVTSNGFANRLRVTDCSPAHALVSFAVPSSSPARSTAYRSLAEVAVRIQDLRNFGSTVCDLLDVATGTLDGFVSVNPKPWDVSAGLAFVAAAGGISRTWRRTDGQLVLVAGGAALVEALEWWLR